MLGSGALRDQELRSGLLEEAPGVGAEYQMDLGLVKGHARLRNGGTAANLAPACDRGPRGGGVTP